MQKKRQLLLSQSKIPNLETNSRFGNKIFRNKFRNKFRGCSTNNLKSKIAFVWTVLENLSSILTMIFRSFRKLCINTSSYDKDAFSCLNVKYVVNSLSNVNDHILHVFLKFFFCPHDKITKTICGKIFKVVYKLRVHITKTLSVVSLISIW